MNYKQVKEFSDPDTFTARFDEENGIVSLNFAVNAIAFTAQYGSECNGVYAFGVADDQQVEKMFKMLQLV
jgi:hypothetical protein